MKKQKLILLLLMVLMPMYGLAETTMSRDDIIDFCDTVPQDVDAPKADERTIRAARILGANQEQAEAMNKGVVLARALFSLGQLSVSVSNFTGNTASPDAKKSFESICKSKVREKLFELSEK